MGICTSTGLRHTMDRPMRALRIRGSSGFRDAGHDFRGGGGVLLVSVSDLTGA